MRKKKKYRKNGRKRKKSSRNRKRKKSINLPFPEEERMLRNFPSFPRYLLLLLPATFNKNVTKYFRLFVNITPSNTHIKLYDIPW